MRARAIAERNGLQVVGKRGGLQIVDEDGELVFGTDHDLTPEEVIDFLDGDWWNQFDIFLTDGRDMIAERVGQFYAKRGIVPVGKI